MGNVTELAKFHTSPCLEYNIFFLLLMFLSTNILKTCPDGQLPLQQD